LSLYGAKVELRVGHRRSFIVPSRQKYPNIFVTRGADNE